MFPWALDGRTPATGAERRLSAPLRPRDDRPEHPQAHEGGCMSADGIDGFKGALFTPDHAGYEEARTLFSWLLVPGASGVDGWLPGREVHRRRCARLGVRASLARPLVPALGHLGDM